MTCIIVAGAMPDHLPIVPPRQAEPPFYWGVDVGGTNIKLGLVDHRGQTLAYQKLPTEEPTGPEEAIRRTVAAGQEMLQELNLDAYQVVRAGLGTPGSMDLARGLLLDPPNLPNWWNFPIRDAFAEAFDLPVSFINDANAAAYGEYWLGSGRDHHSMIFLTLGTGVGGGIVVAGELVNGVNSFGSECGHIVVDSRHDAETCVWGGGRGQLEAYASAPAVARQAERRLSDGSVTGPLGEMANGAEQLTAKTVYEAALAGDQPALEIILDAGRWLGVGVTTLVHTIDPGMVVLGGAMDFGGASSSVGQQFLARVRQEFVSRTFDHVAAGTVIRFAELGGAAGYLGAAGYARWQHAQEK